MCGRRACPTRNAEAGHNDSNDRHAVEGAAPAKRAAEEGAEWNAERDRGRGADNHRRHGPSAAPDLGCATGQICRGSHEHPRRRGRDSTRGEKANHGLGSRRRCIRDSEQ
jgi:hypothetical protein